MTWTSVTSRILSVDASTGAAGVGETGELVLIFRSAPFSQSRIQDLVQRVTAHNETENYEHYAHAGLDEVPPRTQRDRAALERGLEHRPPGDVEGIAEAEERERRLGKDRHRNDQDGVGEDEGKDVRQNVPANE